MRFYETILRYPRSVITAILLITLLFAWQARRVELNNSIEELLPEGHPSLVQDREIKQVFNSREMILIAIVREDGIFRPETLRKVQELTAAAWQVTIAAPGDARTLDEWGERLGGAYREIIAGILPDGLDVADRGAVNNLLIRAKEDPEADAEFIAFLEELQLELAPLSDVISLASVDDITSTDFGLRLESPLEEVPETDEALAELVAKAFGNEMFVNLLVSPDSTGALILAELAFYYDDHIEMADRVFEKLEALAAPLRGPERVELGGVPMVNVYTASYMTRDMSRLTLLVVLLVMAVMYASFRTLRGVLIPISVVLVAIVWTVGVMGIVGRPITLVVAFMPVMLIAIGVADGIHLITEYRLLSTKGRSHDEAILETMRRLSRPVILTSLTTMAGFAALATSNLRSIRDFGIFTAVGVLAAMIFSLTFVPAALKRMKPLTPSADWRGTGSGLALALRRLGELAIRRRRAVFVGALTLAALSGVLASRIEIGSSMVGFFKEGSEIRRASQLIMEKFGGIEVMNIVIDTKRKDGLKDPAVLGKIAALQDTLESLAIVGYTSSLADYVKRTNLVMNENDPAFNRLPGEVEIVTETVWVGEGDAEVAVERQVEVSGRDLISQYMLLYESAGGDDLEKLADFDYSKANVIALIREDYTPELKRVMETAQAFTEANFGSDVEVTYAGCSTLCVVADTLIIPGQMRSLGMALLVVLGLLILSFRSVRYGVIALLPILLTVAVVFLLLGVFGLRLDSVKALIASIVLGIGVDYSVHFLSRYRSLRAEGLGHQEAVRQTMVTSGRAIVYNSLAVAIGFSVLLLSSFWPVIHMGWLVSANMFLSAILALVLLPAVLGRRSGEEADEPVLERVSRAPGGAAAAP